VPFGLATGIASALMFRDLPVSLGPCTGAVSGILFGLFMGVVLARQNRSAREVARFPPGQERSVLLAAGRGPVPTDPAVREAALRLAIDQRARLVRWRVPFTVMLGLVVTLNLVAAVLGNPWQWLYAVPLVGIAVLQGIGLRLTERRIAVLRGTTPSDQHADH
jgi:hypothetical protein